MNKNVGNQHQPAERKGLTERRRNNAMFAPRSENVYDHGDRLGTCSQTQRLHEDDKIETGNTVSKKKLNLRCELVNLTDDDGRIG